MTRLNQDIRRLANGAIDFDHYRRRAMDLRSAEMTAFFKDMGTGLKPLIAFTALASVLFAVAI
jgi:hypothetical protein